MSSFQPVLMPAQLIALFTALSYASCLLSARRCLVDSNPLTVSFVSAIVQTITLWSAVFLTGGIPEVQITPTVLFVIAGILQLGVRLLAFSGIHKIGANRSSTLQATSPLIASIVAIVFLLESTTFIVLLGTLLVVSGIILITWRPEEQIQTYRWWHALLPLGAACLTGINHPLRRHALSMTNEPVFFAAVMGITSFSFVAAYIALPTTRARLLWRPRSLLPLLGAGLFETLSILLIITALSVGTVVIVAPIAGTYPLWVTLATVVFSRNLEQVNARTMMATVCVVAGTAAIHLGK